MLVMPELSFTDAYFETMSGMTTTGATVLSGLDTSAALDQPLACHAGSGWAAWASSCWRWRSCRCWASAARQMFKAETPGPMKDAKLTPRITETAKGLWLVYVGITLACVHRLRAGRHDLVRRGVHMLSPPWGWAAFPRMTPASAISIRPPSSLVAIVFMLIAGINFATHFLAWRSKACAPYTRDPEARHGSSLIMLGKLSLALRCFFGCTASIPISGRRCATPASTWFRSPPPPVMPAPTSTCGRSSRRCGCCSCAASRRSSGSTGGGIKMIRALLLFRQGREFVQAAAPAAPSSR